MVEPGRSPFEGSALLVIDVQQGLFEKSTPIYQAKELIANLNLLMDRARQAGAPVVVIQHSNEKALRLGSPAWQLHPELHLDPGDCLVHKLHGNAFEATLLEEYLISKQVRRLVVTGLVTHGCVRATCLGALESGYRVVLVQDGHSNYHRQAAALIAEWNAKLAGEGIEVLPAAAIEFGQIGGHRSLVPGALGRTKARSETG